MSAVRSAVEDYLASGPVSVSCEQVRDYAEQRCGHHVNGTAVSRIAGNLGWEKFREGGKVQFRRPTKQ